MANLVAQRLNEKKPEASRRGIIGLDVDGTVADTFRIVARIEAEKHGLRIPRGGISNYFIAQWLGIAQKSTNEAFKQVWERPDAIPLIDQRIPRLVESLRRRYAVHITTTAGDGTRGAQVKRFLDIHGVPYDEFYNVPTSQHKVDLGHIDVYIEDSHHTAQKVAETDRITILLQQRWNMDFIETLRRDDPNGTGRWNGHIVPARNWIEIHSLLRGGIL